MFLSLIRLQSSTVLFFSLFFGRTVTLQDPSSPARGQRLQSQTTTFPTRTLSPDAGDASGGGAEDLMPAVPLPQALTLPGVDAVPRRRPSLCRDAGVCVLPSCVVQAVCSLGCESAARYHFGCGPCSAHGASAGLRGTLPLISTLPQSPKRNTTSGNAHLEARMPREYEVGVPRFSVKGRW